MFFIFAVLFPYNTTLVFMQYLCHANVKRIFTYSKLFAMIASAFVQYTFHFLYKGD